MFLVQATISHLNFCSNLLPVTLPPFHPPHCSQTDLKLIMSVYSLNLQWLALIVTKLDPYSSNWQYSRPVTVLLLLISPAFSPSAPLYRCFTSVKLDNLLFSNYALHFLPLFMLGPI